jgi:cytochrome c biogenesis protein CcmG/thiol:disulfide interchange protein DsbE
MSRGLMIAVIGAAAALAGLLVYGVASKGTSSRFEDAIARGAPLPAPAATLDVLGSEGVRMSLADYRGKVVVLNLWASWCDPCRDELPLLQKTHEKISAQGGTVLGINTKDLVDGAMESVREYGLSFPSLRDGDGAYARALEHTGVPETFVLDREGAIAAIRRFPVDQAWLDEVLPPLLEAKA